MYRKCKYYVIVALFCSLFSIGYSVDRYLEVLQKEGMEPVSFIQKKLTTRDLIIFDDAIHAAVEPFNFYKDLIIHPDTRLDFVFIEIFSIATQPYIDAFFENETKDESLLMKVFQDDFSGYGYRYESYLNLLSAIWEHNQNQDDRNKIRVIGVDQPIYWEGIHTRQDYDIFLKSLIVRDYFFYEIICQYMHNFENNKKAIFLTNTRHAYKNIRVNNGEIFWNAGTFFHHWQSEKTFSARIHNVTLSIEATQEYNVAATAEGLEGFKFSWIKMENGIWDEAFKRYGNKPIAFELKDNIFGNAKYVGNLVLIADQGQTIYDAYDALIFLKPLDELHFTAMTDFFYTPEFKKELKRRIEILQEGHIEDFLLNHGVDSVEEYIDIISVKEPMQRNNLLNQNE